MNPPYRLVLCALLAFSTAMASEFSCRNVQPPCNCTLVMGQQEYGEASCRLEDNGVLKLKHILGASKSKVECTKMNALGEHVDVVAPLTPADFPAALADLSVTDYTIVDCALSEDSLEALGVAETRSLSIAGNTLFEGQVLGANFFRSVAPQLEALEISRNGLKDVEQEVFSGMGKLSTLYLTKNKLEVINGQFAGLSELVDLDLSHNFIHTITDDAFAGLSKLKILHLYNNKISIISAHVLSPLSSLLSLELSGNLIRKIEDGSLDNLKQLQRINIRLNKITSLPDELFKYNKVLDRVRFGSNPDLQTLPNGFLADLPKLSTVNIDYCSLKELPGDLFENSPRIQDINLQNNNLTSLPNNLFRDTAKLMVLNLDDNYISQLDNSPFQQASSLTTLNLSNNNLTHISQNTFKGLSSLETLSLTGNEIATANLMAFPNSLKTLDMSHNKLQLEGVIDSSIFNGLVNLEDLNLSYNSITDVIQDFSLYHLRMLNLSHNKITHINYGVMQTTNGHKVQLDLRDNAIQSVDLSELEVVAASPNNVINSTVLLDNNPLRCDCGVYDLLRFLEGKMGPGVGQRVSIWSKNLVCESPEKYAGRNVHSIGSTELNCDVENCVPSCTCLYRPFNSTFILDCAGRGLKRAPLMKMPTHFRRTELHLQDNFLTEYTSNYSIYENVTVLNVSNNLISEFTWMSNKSEMVFLDNNNISRLNDNVMANFSMQVTLHNNPWICDCKGLKLLYYVKNHLIPNKANITCAKNNRTINALQENDMCLSNEIMIVAIVLGVAFLITVPSVIFAFYYRFNREIKVWLYARNMFLWFVTEEDLDRDKVYDAFISFSHVDEQFVLKELVSKLEGGANPFKLCIHIRNWVPGEFIATQVMDSVRNSRRTIVVLSPDFLESVWGKMEFRTAHTQAMSEGRARVIVILLGNVDVESGLDDELQVYLKTNTYIKWGDPWFWDKLRYALPHQAKLGGSAKKLQNISINLDKMDLINGNTTPNITSTPPAHPLLLKSHPLDFRAADNMRVTPPAESGNDMVIITNGCNTDDIKIRM